MKFELRNNKDFWAGMMFFWHRRRGDARRPSITPSAPR